MENLANSKQTAKKPNKSKSRNTSPKKKTSGSSARKRVEPKREPKLKMSPRIKSLLYFAAALISLLIIFVPGASVWEFIRGVFYGFLGISIILVPILLIYFAVITAREKTIAHFKTKFIAGVGIIVLSECGVYLLSSEHFLDKTYFSALGSLFANGYNAQNKLLSGGGLFSGIIGYPLLTAFGWWASVGVVFVLLITLCLIIFKVSLNDMGRVAVNVGKGVSQAYERQEERRRQRRERAEREPQIDYFGDEKFDTQIDIDLGNSKKKRKPKKRKDTSSIDISIDDDRKPEKNTNEAMDKFMDAVKKAQGSELSEDKKPRKSARKPKESEKTTDIVTEENTYKFPPV